MTNSLLLHSSMFFIMSKSKHCKQSSIKGIAIIKFQRHDIYICYNNMVIINKVRHFVEKIQNHLEMEC